MLTAISVVRLQLRFLINLAVTEGGKFRILDILDQKLKEGLEGRGKWSAIARWAGRSTGNRRMLLDAGLLYAHPNDSNAFCALHAQRAMAEHCPYLSILRSGDRFSGFSAVVGPFCG